MLPTTRFVLLLTFLSLFSSRAQDTSAPNPGAFDRDMASQVEEADGPLYQPLVERYGLDELRALRQDMQGLRVELIEKVASARLDASDRAIRYTADTTNNIFYIITAAASILVLLGWRSMRDIRKNIESVTTKKLAELTEEYEARLHEIESKMKLRSEQIMSAHEEISKANLVHGLWMRAALEKSAQEKVNLYDQILEIKPDDVEALTYKADALLEMGEVKWALSLTRNTPLPTGSEPAPMRCWENNARRSLTSKGPSNCPRPCATSLPPKRRSTPCARRRNFAP